MTYVHPHFPLIYKPLITKQYSLMHNPNPNSREEEVPIMLLLAMFSVAARYSDLEPNADPHLRGENYFKAAKSLLNETYHSTKLITVQVLLLFSYRQIGIGAMSESWIFLGMGVRMAQDLGLFRDVDKWFMPVRKFSYEEKQTRKRVWWSCVVLDKYVSTYIGMSSFHVFHASLHEGKNL
jgi:hypothetical protein